MKIMHGKRSTHAAASSRKSDNVDTVERLPEGQQAPLSSRVASQVSGSAAWLDRSRELSAAIQVP
ncbi:hypothetical protein [Burkholderia plantarii]|uniref:hypothetical protein n=1 Tax=Burkholderia plantarii TaxID=41899 RepID=UPI00114D30C1|nr:hypothetical protein [Burkholderia plantarii]